MNKSTKSASILTLVILSLSATVCPVSAKGHGHGKGHASGVPIVTVAHTGSTTSPTVSKGSNPPAHHKAKTPKLPK